MNIQLITNDKIAETSSKGNQEKWYDKKENTWFKLDKSGYEALSEVIISILLEKSNIETETPFRFVRYNMGKFTVHGNERTGCSSLNFLKPNQTIITLANLLNKSIDGSLMKKFNSFPSDKRRISYLSDTVTEITGLCDFSQYLTLIFEIDFLFLNDDRHLNNIAVLEQNNKYDYCPIFDNGAGLLSDTQMSPMDISTNALISSLRARPFNMTFTRLLHTTRSLYGKLFNMPNLTKNDVHEILEPILLYYPKRDRAIISDRVIYCIMHQQKNFV